MRARRGGPGPAATPPPGLRARVRGDRGDRGAVTAELALALPAVVLVVVMLLVTGSATVAQVRSVDAARTVARLVAAGHPDAEASAAAHRVAGGSVAVDIARDGAWVDVTVRRDLAGAWFTGGPLSTTARASAWAEP